MADVSLPQSTEYYRVEIDNGPVPLYKNRLSRAELEEFLRRNPEGVARIEHVIVQVRVLNVTEVFLQ